MSFFQTDEEDIIMAKYKRVLIKLSGEALGDNGRLFDFEQIDRVAAVIGELHKTGTEIAIVIGAGNIWRGRQGPAAKMTAINADHMGMLGTTINSIAMQDAVERLGIESRVMSAVEMTRFCEPYTYRRAEDAHARVRAAGLNQGSHCRVGEFLMVVAVD